MVLRMLGLSREDTLIHVSKMREVTGKALAQETKKGALKDLAERLFVKYHASEGKDSGLATMSLEDKIALIERQRESARKGGKGGKDNVQRLSADLAGLGCKDLAELQIRYSIPNVSKGQGEGTHDGLGLAAPLELNKKGVVPPAAVQP